MLVGLLVCQEAPAASGPEMPAYEAPEHGADAKLDAHLRRQWQLALEYQRVAGSDALRHWKDYVEDEVEV